MLYAWAPSWDAGYIHKVAETGKILGGAEIKKKTMKIPQKTPHKDKYDSLK